MKKLMILAVAAIALVACSKTFDTGKSNDAAIGFGTWTETLTKAGPASIGNAFAVGDEFNVWGGKLVSSTFTPVFAGVTVEKTAASPETWNYSPKQYWDLSATSYTFYGISPAEDGYTVNAETGAVTASPTITFAGNTNDVLVAQKAVVAKDFDGDTVDDNFNNFDKVHLIFNHVAALVDVKVKISAGLVAAGAHVQVSSIALTNISKEGTFTVAGGYTTAPVASWTPSTAAAGTTGSFGPTNGCTDASAGLNTDLNDTGTILINQLIVIPQEFRTTGDYIQKLDIDYNITQAGGTANNFTPDPFALTTFDNTPNTSNTGDTNVTGWASGYHYTYVVTIDAHAIDFTAEVSNNWTLETAYNYLCN